MKYRCTACGKVAKNNPLHIFHVLKHTGEKPYKCTMPGCFKAFRSLAGLESHLAFHGKDRNYVCDICHASFKHNTVLARHKKIHTNNRKFKRKYCSGTFLRRFDCSVHETRHKPNQEVLKQCNLCNNTYLNGLMLKRHKAEEHGITENYRETNRTVRTFTCRDCLAIFDGQNGLQQHKKHCEVVNSVFKCRFCIQKFATIKQWSDHENNDHDDKWKCKICDDIFETEDNLRRHTVDAHVSQSDKFIVTIEPGSSLEKFPKNRLRMFRLSSRQVEISILRKICPELVDKTYICPICAQHIIGVNEMHLHLQLHGKSDGYTCDKCGQILDTADALRLHLQLIHDKGIFTCS